MGSLTSRPKAPSVAAETSAAPSATTDAADAAASASAAEAQAEAETAAAGNATADTATAAADETATITPEAERQASLLERSRGALSTVLTSFRGVLDDNIDPQQPKTLLGE
jgi:hypothetical protein